LRPNLAGKSGAVPRKKKESISGRKVKISLAVNAISEVRYRDWESATAQPRGLREKKQSYFRKPLGSKKNESKRPNQTEGMESPQGSELYLTSSKWTRGGRLITKGG